MHVCRRQAPPTRPRTLNQHVDVETPRKLCHIGEDAASVSDVGSLLMDPASLFFPISRIMSSIPRKTDTFLIIKQCKADIRLGMQRLNHALPFRY